MFTPSTVTDVYAVFSGVQRGTPVYCCNYFDYTYYGVLQQSGERVQFNLQWISILTENKRKKKFALWNIWSAERYSYGYMLWVCVFVCEYNKQQGCILDCEVQGSYFPLLLISFPWWALVCIHTCDSPGGLIGDACSPKRCQVPDSEQMLTNRNTNTPEGPCVCMHLCIPPFD